MAEHARGGRADTRWRAAARGPVHSAAGQARQPTRREHPVARGAVTRGAVTRGAVARGAVEHDAGECDAGEHGARAVPWSTVPSPQDQTCRARKAAAERRWQRTGNAQQRERPRAACGLGGAVRVPHGPRRADARPHRLRVELVAPSCAGRSTGSVPWLQARRTTRQSSTTVHSTGGLTHLLGAGRTARPRSTRCVCCCPLLLPRRARACVRIHRACHMFHSGRSQSVVGSERYVRA